MKRERAAWPYGMGGCMLKLRMHAAIVHTDTHATQNRHPHTASSHAIDDAHAVGRTHKTHTQQPLSGSQAARQATREAGREGLRMKENKNGQPKGDRKGEEGP